jgi:hypothetical protein
LSIRCEFPYIEEKGFYGVKVDSEDNFHFEKYESDQANPVLLNGKEITAWDYRLV